MRNVPPGPLPRLPAPAPETALPALAGRVVSPNDGTLLDRPGGRNIVDPAVPFDSEADAVALIEAQAAIPDSCIGAFVQVTAVRRDRIEMRVLAP